ncbi:hypothetical protein D9757_004522 [Collybiopsis confluens]|uniref:Uncharacterized protein n=1 Tax=Collybiopsis confluens TaxID=2823264 RepID=A0A8H5MEB9_9AGAR|nr:hypothetical protein D9757_004522 [Collybiopsis confluens]
MEELSLSPRRQTSSLHSSDYNTLKHVSESHSGTFLEQNYLRVLALRVGDGYPKILSIFFLAAVIACMNHFIFAHFDGMAPGNHTDQFWVTVLKNVFPTAVGFLLSMSLKLCLAQVALYHIRLNSYPLDLVNLTTSPPGILNTLSILFKSSMRMAVVCFALLAILTQAVTLTSVFAPATLAVVAAPSRMQTLAIPTIDFNVVDTTESSIYVEIPVSEHPTDPAMTITLDFLDSSQKWRQLILRASSSNIAPTWDPPVGCGSACSYSFTYFAPALNCTNISKQDIWPNGPSTNDSGLDFPTQSTSNFYYYNSTASSIFDLDVIYMPDFNTTTLEHSLKNLTAVSDPNQWSPAGARCSYQNATYEASTHFLNNTQFSSTRVKEWHGQIGSPGLPAGVAALGDSITNMTMAYCSIAGFFSEILVGATQYEPNLIIDIDGVSALFTQLFVLAEYAPTDKINITSYDPSSGVDEATTVTTFSLSPTLAGDLAAGLHELLGNVTLAFVNEQMATTYANVTTIPDNTEYQYVGWRLGLIYGIAFSGSLTLVAYGLFCLQKNGESVIFDLKHILEMTATSTRLHESAVRPEFGSTLVRGISFPDADEKQSKRMVLDVID